MWLIVGLILGAVVSALVLWLRNRNIKVTWYEWLIGVIGLLLLLFTIDNFVNAFAEYQEAAPLMYLLVTGLPSLILLSLAVQLALMRRRKSA